jgi:hypothetical protein
MYVYDFGPVRCGSLCSFSRALVSRRVNGSVYGLLSGLLLLLVLVALSLTWNWETYEVSFGVNLPTSMTVNWSTATRSADESNSLFGPSIVTHTTSKQEQPLGCTLETPVRVCVLFLTEYQRPNCFTSFTGTDGEVLAWILRSYFWPMIPTRPVYGTPRYQQGVARGTTRSFVASHESK